MDWEIERPLPQFIVIGAMKAGTTSLYYYLRRHPQILVSDSKELDFFIREKNWGQGEEWYRRQFPRSRCRVRGEFSANYAKYPLFSGVPKRMASLIPNARLIYLLRNPFDRFVSQYRDHVLRGAERRTIQECLKQKKNEYLLNSDYSLQLAQYLRHFRKDRILLVSSARLREEKRRTLKKIYAFLGVNPLHAHADDVVDHNEFQTKWNLEYLSTKRRQDLLRSSFDADLWSRDSAAREILNRSVEKLARAWPKERWIEKDLASGSAGNSSTA